MMKLTAQDLLNYKVIDEIVPEPRGGAQLDHKALFDALDAILDRNLNQLSRMGGNALAGARYKKFRQMGTV